MRPERNLQFADALLAGLVSAGVRHAVVSPGSRSSPLAIACARCGGLDTRVVLDERGAAFLAGGIARATDTPVAVICTSGTAVANWLPGAVEASHSGLPLILLSADRPPELRNCGSPQTIDQAGIFGTFVRWYHEAPVPDTVDNPAELGWWLAAEAVSRAAGTVPGPVHLNLPFREPLVPETVGNPAPVPGIPRSRRSASPDQAAVDAVAAAVSRNPGGWIVAGPLGPELRSAAAAFARATGYPVLADATSNLRFGSDLTVCSAADAWLRVPEAVEEPGLVIRLGGLPSSKVINQYLERSRARQILIAATPGDGDPAKRAVEHRPAGLRATLEALARALQPGAQRPVLWAEQVATEEISTTLDGTGELSEPGIARTVASAIPAGSCLFVSNSMPVRDLDWFSAASGRRIDVYANRGANGIDGITSSALGVAIGSGRPVYLLAGDLAVLHDTTALAAAAGKDIPLTVIVVNNSGGGIFRNLPASRIEESFEKYFLTPQTVDFSRLAAAFGASFERPATAGSLSALLGRPACGLRVIEVQVDGEASVALRREIWTRVAARLQPEFRKAASA